jgi:dTMP kinase
MMLKNFVVFEGIDGSGTSTQIDILKKRVLQTGDKKQFLFTCEPTTEVTGQFLRTILSGEYPADSRTAAFLFAADRAEHLYGERGILKALAQGKVVISDRYLFSSLAYQSVDCGRELPRLLNSAFPLPELLFFFDIDPALSLTRIAGREVTEIYEKQDFLEKTAVEYRRIIAEYQETQKDMRIVRLDARQSAEAVAKVIWQELEEHHVLEMR